MNRLLTAAIVIIGIGASLGWRAPANAQSTPTQSTIHAPRTPGSALSENLVREKLNTWTVGLAGGQLEGAPIRLAAEIGRVVDDGDNLHVLSIVTRGPTENVEDLLYLRGVDVAIINTDALDQFRQLVPDIQQRITYILSLFPSEVHIFVRPEIKSLEDLKGKKVNFNTPGTSAAYSGPLIFSKLNVAVDATFIPHQVALEQMRTGQNGMEAVVFVTSKPIDAFLHKHWEPGFKFLPVAISDFGFYLPSSLTSVDYPDLIPPGQDVQTIAVPTVLAAYNWQIGSDRYKRVARLTDYLFDRLGQLHEPGFHPAWRDVNANAKVPGLNRFPEAQAWLDRAKGAAAPAQSAASGDSTDDQRLYQQFLEWRKHQPQ
jgi:hypothetical protein